MAAIDVACSFCGKHQREVENLIAGPAGYIFSECIGLCANIISERRAKLRDSEPGSRPPLRLFVVQQSESGADGWTIGPRTLDARDPVLYPDSTIELVYPDGTKARAKLAAITAPEIKLIVKDIENIPVGTEVWAI